MVSKAAQELGKKGGMAKSEAKTVAARANAKKPRRKWITGVAYHFFDTNGGGHSGLILMPGKWFPETTAGFPETKKMLEDHAKAKYAYGDRLEVEHIHV